MTETPTYASWQAMIVRCENPRRQNFARYGGRGVVVCARWRESFEAFVEDMGERRPGTTLDRINPDGNYEPDNCRWATTAEQHGNRRCSVRLTLDGRTQTLKAWALELGISYFKLYNRLRKGLPAEEVLRVTTSAA